MERLARKNITNYAIQGIILTSVDFIYIIFIDTMSELRSTAMFATFSNNKRRFKHKQVGTLTISW